MHGIFCLVAEATDVFGDRVLSEEALQKATIETSKWTYDHLVNVSTFIQNLNSARCLIKRVCSQYIVEFPSRKSEEFAQCVSRFAQAALSTSVTKTTPNKQPFLRTPGSIPHLLVAEGVWFDVLSTNAQIALCANSLDARVRKFCQKVLLFEVCSGTSLDDVISPFGTQDNTLESLKNSSADDATDKIIKRLCTSHDVSTVTLISTAVGRLLKRFKIEYSSGCTALLELILSSLKIKDPSRLFTVRVCCTWGIHIVHEVMTCETVCSCRLATDPLFVWQLLSAVFISMRSASILRVQRTCMKCYWRLGSS